MLRTRASVGAPYFSYWTIFTLALLGGMLGVLMMVPLRRALIVKEHGNLPYPEGAACAQVLIAGEQGGQMARIAYLGLAFSTVYAALQLIFGVIAATPGYVTRATSRLVGQSRRVLMPVSSSKKSARVLISLSSVSGAWFVSPAAAWTNAGSTASRRPQSNAFLFIATA